MERTEATPKGPPWLRALAMVAAAAVVLVVLWRYPVDAELAGRLVSALFGFLVLLAKRPPPSGGAAVSGALLATVGVPELVANILGGS